MAGTRLLIHSIFVIELIILLLIALYFSQYKSADYNKSHHKRRTTSLLFSQRDGIAHLPSLDDLPKTFPPHESSSIPKTIVSTDGRQASSTALSSRVSIIVTLLHDHFPDDDDDNNNHDNLSSILSNATRTVLHPFINNLDGLLDVNLMYERELSYLSLSTGAVKDHDDEYYTLPLSRWDTLGELKLLSPHRYITEDNDDDYDDDVTNLDFIVYVPPSHHTPLFLYDDKQTKKTPGVAWYHPGRAVVVIYNPNDDTGAVVADDDGMTIAMEYFVTALRHHLGLTSSLPPSSSSSSTSSCSASLLVGIDDEEKEALYHHWIPLRYNHVMEQFHIIMTLIKTKKTLPVTTELAHRLKQAKQALHQALALFVSSSDPVTTLHHINHAQRLVSSVRSDPSMMEPMHFLMEQWAAVFMPLLAPLMIPLIYGWYREIVRYREKSKHNTKK